MVSTDRQRRLLFSSYEQRPNMRPEEQSAAASPTARALPWLISVLLLAASLALYVGTLAKGMLRGDALDFQLAMATLGVPHATGYPLFTLLGWLWLRLLPWGELTTRASLLSAVFAALVVVLLYRLALLITKRHLAALAGAVALGLSYVFWSQAIVAEVYTLNALFLLCLLYLLFLWQRERELPHGNRRLQQAALVYGLSLAHHRLMLLLLPAILVYVCLVDAELLRDIRRLSRLILIGCAGLLFYIYIPLRLLPQGKSGQEILWNTIFGGQFLQLFGLRRDWWDIIWRYPRDQMSIAGMMLALLGAMALIRKESSRRSGILLLLCYISTLILCLFYGVPDIQVFLTPCFVILGLWIAVGIDELSGLAGPRLRPVAQVLGLAAALLLLVNLSPVREYARSAPGGIRARAEQIMASDMVAGAIVQADFETTAALQFLQAVEGHRPDLRIERLQLGLEENYRRLLGELDAGAVAYFPAAEGFNLTRFDEQYDLSHMPGDLLRISDSDDGFELVQRPISDEISLRGYRVDSQATTLFWELQAPVSEAYASFVHFFDANQTPLGQADKQEMAEGSFIFPTYNWLVGQIVQDNFPPPPDGTAFVRTGMYRQTEQGLASHGRPLVFSLTPADHSLTPNRIGATLGSSIALSGYGLLDDDDAVRLTLLWECMDVVEVDYTVFVHVIEQGQITHQYDQHPLNGFFPTSMWSAGDRVSDSYQLPYCQADTELRVGLYDADTMTRLEIAGSDLDYITIACGELDERLGASP